MEWEDPSSNPMLDIEKEIDNLEKGTFEEENGYSWDLVFVFPSVHEDFGGSNVPGVNATVSAEDVVRRFATGGLETEQLYTSKGRAVICLVRASVDRLEKEALRTSFKIELNEEEAQKTAEIGKAEVNIQPIRIVDTMGQCKFRPFEHIYGVFRKEPAFQQMYLRKGGRHCVFNQLERIKLILSIIGSSKGCGLDIDLLVHRKRVMAYYPLHKKSKIQRLKQSWLRWNLLPWEQPLQEVRGYLGEGVALFFAFSGHLTRSLVIPSIVGCLFFILVSIAGSVGQAALAFYIIFTAVWGIHFLIQWSREREELSMIWGVPPHCDVIRKKIRAQFRGITIPSPVDGKPMRYMVPISRQLGYAITSILLTATIAVLVALLGAMFFMESYIRESNNAGLHVPYLGSIAVGLLNPIFILCFAPISRRIVVALADYENHETEEEYKRSLIFKSFLLDFITNYGALFYISFARSWAFENDCEESDCFFSLQIIMGMTVLLKLVLGNIARTFPPLIKALWNTICGSEMKSDQETHQAEKQLALRPHGLSKEIKYYLDLIIRFGYVTLFVVACPLTPILIMLSNAIEQKITATKMLLDFRRTIPSSTAGIAVWEQLIKFLILFGVFVNIGVWCYTSTWMKDWSESARLEIFYISLFTLYGGLFCYWFGARKTSTDVEIQRERQHYLSSKLIYDESAISTELVETKDSVKRPSLEISSKYVSKFMA